MMKKTATSKHRTPAFRRTGINDAGYECPRFNLESQRLSWLKTIRSAGSRAAANAMLTSPKARTAYENFAGPERILISSHHMEVSDLPKELSGIRIIQLTDIHHGPWLPVEFVSAIVDKVNGLKPDIVALTGDYVINSPRYIQPVVKALADLKPKIATVGVLGNHDWWEGGRALTDALESTGVQMLDNRRSFLTTSRELVSEATEGICLAGVGDAWTDRVDFDAALKDVPDHMPRILLSHNPDCAEDKHFLRSKYRVDLMLSGHTHGGQVCFPSNGKPVLPKIRKHKYARGLVYGPQCPVYICRGIGTAGVPLRLGADPEIAVFDLISA